MTTEQLLRKIADARRQRDAWIDEAERAFARPTRARRERTAARNADAWDARLQDLLRLLRRRRQRKKPPPSEPMYSEWEFGSDYAPDARSEAAADASHYVDINFHLVRADGRKFGQRDAQKAMSEFVRTKRVPAGYRIAVADWRQPELSTGWRTSSHQGIMRSWLRNVLDAMSDDTSTWRLGAIK